MEEIKPFTEEESQKVKHLLDFLVLNPQAKEQFAYTIYADRFRKILDSVYPNPHWSKNIKRK